MPEILKPRHVCVANVDNEEELEIIIYDRHQDKVATFHADEISFDLVGDKASFHPSVSLLSKLGSIAVHLDEMLSSDGHVFDKVSLEVLQKDPEVIEWLSAMDKMALLPKKRL